MIKGWRKPPDDFIGRRFGMLVVIESAPEKNRKRYFRCRCDCGGERVTNVQRLKKGTTVSCGCFRAKRAAEMGRARYTGKKRCDTPEYTTWENMMQRCFNPNCKDYKDYGGRGIKVCDRWKSFDNFYSDMGQKPKGFSIERINVNGDYEPSNCGWASMHTQSRNKTNNRRITYNGSTRILADWAKEYDLSYSCLRARLENGWDVESALLTPPLR